VAGLVLVGTLTVATQVFFHLIEARPGRIPGDPLLEAVPSRDVSSAIFVVLYGGILTGLAAVPRQARQVARLLHAYALLLALRLLSMWAVPLEPPPGIIPLQDPVTALFYPERHPFLKDLFFSGHTATMALLALAVGPGAIRKVLWGATGLVGALLLVQHVHYTIDIVAAPFFSWLAWRASRMLIAETALVDHVNDDAPRSKHLDSGPREGPARRGAAGERPR
jgi:hypothetical protein